MRLYRIGSTAALVAGAATVFALGVATGNGFHRADARPPPVQQEEVGGHQVAQKTLRRKRELPCPGLASIETRGKRIEGRVNMILLRVTRIEGRVNNNLLRVTRIEASLNKIYNGINIIRQTFGFHDSGAMLRGRDNEPPRYRK